MRTSSSRLNPEEEPSAAAGHLTEIPMSGQDRADFLMALAETYNTAPRADIILDAIDFPAAQRPTFTTSSDQAWNDIFREIARGIVPAGFRQLLEAALRVYGHNATFVELRGRYLEAPPRPEVVAEPPGQRLETCHVIFRADTEDERTAVRSWLEGAQLAPVEVWSTPSSVSFQINADDSGAVRTLLDQTSFGWTVVPPGAPDYLLRQIFVDGPDGRRFRVVDAPAQQTVGNVAAEVVDRYGPTFPGAKRPTVIDHVRSDGSGQRVDPGSTLHDQGIRDGDRLRVGFQATAAAGNPADRENALFRVKNQILAYAAAHPDLSVAANSTVAPTEYRLEFSQPSFGPPEVPGGEPVAIRRHVVVIMLGAEFPVVAPKVFWMTPFFHPNVYPNYDSETLRENKDAAGLVCLGALDESFHAALDFGDLCSMLRDIAAYRNYSIFLADGTIDGAGRPGIRGDYFDPLAAAWTTSQRGSERIAAIGGNPSQDPVRVEGSYRNLIEPLEVEGT